MTAAAALDSALGSALFLFRVGNFFGADVGSIEGGLYRDLRVARNFLVVGRRRLRGGRQLLGGDHRGCHKAEHDLRQKRDRQSACGQASHDIYLASTFSSSVTTVAMALRVNLIFVLLLSSTFTTTSPSRTSTIVPRIPPMVRMRSPRFIRLS